MTLIKKANIRDYYKIKKILYEFEPFKFNFYSDIPKHLLYLLIKRKCFYILKNDSIQGILFSDCLSKELSYIPITNKITFFKFLYLLDEYFTLNNFELNIYYRNLNINIYKKFFHFTVSNNLKNMHLKISKDICVGENINNNIVIRTFIINKDEVTRVMLQNKIFGDIKGRKDLTVEEVIKEEKNSKFSKDLCFILEADGFPIGYGQIFLISNLYHLVNFGIVPEVREKGYGKYFLRKIISSCFEHNIEDLFLTVDNSNTAAVNLYKKIGFDEQINSASIQF